MRNLIGLIALLLICTGRVSAQESRDMAAAYTVRAEESFREGKYDRTLEYIELAEKMMGRSSADLIYLKVKAQTARFRKEPVPADTATIRAGFRQFFTIMHKQKDPHKRYDEMLALRINFDEWLRDSLTHRMAGLVRVEGGSFLMGSNEGSKEEDAHNDEMPVHTVRITDFYIGRQEVTLEQFWKFIQATGYKTTAELKGWSYIWTGSTWKKVRGITWEHDMTGARRTSQDWDHPVVHVSWYDAVKYCVWMSEQSGRQYRLPTEAEWEFAARGGGRPAPLYGDTMLDAVARYRENSGGLIHRAGTMMANALGLYDMQGNVWEWCQDWYHSDYYAESPKENPQGPSSGSFRVLRGGSWASQAALCSVTARGLRPPDNRNSLTGFRVAVSAEHVRSETLATETLPAATHKKKKTGRKARKNGMHPL